MKKSIIMLLVLTILISILPANMSANNETLSLNTQVEDLKEGIEEELSEENLNLEDFYVSTEELKLEASVENTEGDVGFIKVEVEPGSEFITIFTEETNEFGNIESKQYEVSLNELEYSEETNEIENVTLIDTDTGETFNYNSEEGNASLVFLIPIGLAMSPAVLTALFHTGAMIVVAGSAYVIATEAKKDKKYSHFAAVARSKGIYIGKGLYRTDAISRFKKGNDTWSTTSNNAKSVAQGANTAGNPINEIDRKNGKPKKGYYWHWHAYKRTPKAHAFYGGPAK